MNIILGNYREISVNNTDIKCKCSGKHVPDPRIVYAIDTPDGEVVLCPTGYLNLLSLTQEYRAANGVPLGSVTKHYGKYVRDLAMLLWHSH